MKNAHHVYAICLLHLKFLALSDYDERQTVQTLSKAGKDSIESQYYKIEESSLLTRSSKRGVELCCNSDFEIQYLFIMLILSHEQELHGVVLCVIKKDTQAFKLIASSTCFFVSGVCS